MLKAFIGLLIFFLVYTLTLICFGFYGINVLGGNVWCYSVLTIYILSIIPIVFLGASIVLKIKNELNVILQNICQKIQDFINKIPQPILKILLKLIKN